jgi:hypothetical protein
METLAPRVRVGDNQVMENEMHLSPDQLQSLQHGDPIRVREAGIECVLVRADIFERIKRARLDDDWTPEEMRALAERSLDDADAAGPIP